MKRMPVLLIIATAIVALFPGCGKGPTIQLSYFRQAKYRIPAEVKKVGIAEFGGRRSEDRRWGTIASERLAARLDEYNRKYKRYQLVDRMRLKAILDERDLQMAISDTTTAVRAGKIAQCDAMIYGNVKVMHRDERRSKTKFDPISQRTKTVSYIYRYCMAVVNFTLDDIRTGKTLASASLTREYDSEESGKKSGLGSFMAVGGSNEPPPPDQVISDLVDQCVAEFLSRISPHEVTFTVKLGKGDSDFIKTGNNLAEAGEYKEALDYYQQGLELVPDDHEAMYNAGAMYEKFGNLQKASEFYNKAFKIKPEKEYIVARRRVRQENK